MNDKCICRINDQDIINSSDDDDDEDEDVDDAYESPEESFIQCRGLNEIKRLEDLSWYHSNMTRNTAEALLLTNGVEGTYLLRCSDTHPGKYSVSVRCQDSIMHFSLEYSPYFKSYIFGMSNFDSLKELIEHFHCQPILASESGPTVCLQFPYHNNIPEPSSYEKVIYHAELSKMTEGNISPGLPPDLHIASKEGYLVKRGGIHKNWKKRWFVLKKNLLRYYKRKKSPTPIRTIDMREASHVMEDCCDGKKNCFRLCLPYRIFYFYANSPVASRQWMKILQWKIDYYKEDKETDL